MCATISSPSQHLSLLTTDFHLVYLKIKFQVPVNLNSFALVCNAQHLHIIIYLAYSSLVPQFSVELYHAF